MSDSVARRRYSLARLVSELQRQVDRKDLRAAIHLAQMPIQSRGFYTSQASRRLRKDPWARRRYTVAASGRPRLDVNAGLSKKVMQAGATSTPKPVHRVVDPERFVIAVLDLEAGRLTAADKTCLAAARQIAGLDPGTAVIALSDSDAVGLPEAGADRYEVIPGLRASDGRFAVEAALCSLSIQMTCRAFVFSDTALGRHTARSLAAELGVTPAIGAHDIGSNYCVTRCQSGESDAVHEGLMVLTAKEGFVPPVLSMSFEAAPFQSGVSLAPAESSLVDLGPEFSPADDVALEEAPFVLCGGGGVRDWQLFNDLAVALNATRAGSRVVCDAGHLPRDRQVGASGRSSSAKVYLALGLSGAVQHLQGIENCEEVLAVNTDAAAPIIKRADTSYIADADEVMSEMLRQLVAPE